ncbi:phosphoglycolate phosphatase [Propylenella binzhouense]|uniref:Phosphoglycolate phosphatase n=1 Tax=Propylenella binzhouense TaxID=2555902 RepID=A0A964T2U9_9HYPH|nr:phosphoglycolate phosphatase [Propylenella binzhouense]MYZ47453.1 phosphoglycolate phosphatase [Propylenella binzhouense]
MPDSLLVFDLDGTLVDTAPDLLAALDAVLREHGFPPAGPSARDGIGHGARHLIEVALHRQGTVASSALLDRMHADFLRHYSAHICDGSRPYPGALEALDALEAAGWRFAICTNKLEGLSRELLTTLGIAERFLAICGADTFEMRKPHPGHLLRTIARAGGDPDRAVMVGDSRTDVETARAAGIPFVGVSFGYTPVPMAELVPDLVIDRYDALTAGVLDGLLARRARAEAS